MFHHSIIIEIWYGKEFLVTLTWKVYKTSYDKYVWSENYRATGNICYQATQKIHILLSLRAQQNDYYKCVLHTCRTQVCSVQRLEDQIVNQILTWTVKHTMNYLCSPLKFHDLWLWVSGNYYLNSFFELKFILFYCLPPSLLPPLSLSWL